MLECCFFYLEKEMSVVLQEVEVRHEALTQHVINAVKSYLATVSSKDTNLNLYQLIVEEVEAPLFRTVMELTRYNQSKAARVLGVSRGTLRTKLKRYFDDEFIGTR
jgi:Fis family transcriptional regulator